MDRFVSVDVEIASRRPLRICAIGVVRMEHGHETKAHCSLVHYQGVVSFCDVHGLRAADLRRAPSWPVVWTRVLEVIGDIRTVVASGQATIGQPF